MEEDAVPNVIVVLVTRTWGEMHVHIGGSGLLNPFAFATGLHKHGHRTFAIEGGEVE